MKVTPIFSIEDQDLTDTRWNVSPESCPRKWYPKRSVYNGSRKPTIEYAHKLVIARKIGRKLMKGELCDHINNNKLDNRRENLRVTDMCGNAQNRNYGPYRGATWKPLLRKWQASVNAKHIPKDQRYVGLFDSKVDAAAAALERRRKFGLLEGAI